MDMGEDKKENVWLFADSEGLPTTGIFLSCEDELSSGTGVKYPVITLQGTGVKYKISKWKTDASACVIAWSKDSKNWEGKQVNVSLGKNKKLVLTPTEQKLQ